MLSDTFKNNLSLSVAKTSALEDGLWWGSVALFRCCLLQRARLILNQFQQKLPIKLDWEEAAEKHKNLNC